MAERGKKLREANFSMHLHIVIYYEPINKRASAHVTCRSSESKQQLQDNSLLACIHAKLLQGKRGNRPVSPSNSQQTMCGVSGSLRKLKSV